MKISVVKEFGLCFECGLTQYHTKGPKIYEIEFGTTHIQSLQLCEKCLEKLRSLQQEK